MGADVSRPRLRRYLSRYLFAGPRSVQTLVSVHLVCASNTGGLFSFFKNGIQPSRNGQTRDRTIIVFLSNFLQLCLTFLYVCFHVYSTPSSRRTNF